MSLSSPCGRSSRVHIGASILAADFACLGPAARAAELGGADSIHIDMMDGHYVPNLTFGFDLLPALRKWTTLPLVAHLELDNPDALIEPLAQAGPDMIVVQEDTCPHLDVTIAHIRSYGIGAGVGVNPDRRLEPVLPYLSQVDLLIIMSVPPGFGGQPFDENVLPKVSLARRHRDEHDLCLHVGLDGGVNEGTIVRAVQAGADYLIMGSAIFQRDGVGTAIARLRERICQSMA
jgi:ribulose-phosphate 3-epimerase